MLNKIMPFLFVVVIFTSGCPGAQMKQDPQKLEDLCEDPKNADKAICKYLESRSYELDKVPAQVAGGKGCGGIPAQLGRPWDCGKDFAAQQIQLDRLRTELEAMEHGK